MKNKKLLLGVSALMTAGVLAAGASSTAAWFIASKNVAIDVNTIGLTAETGVLKIKYGAQITSTHPTTGDTKISSTLTEYGVKDTVNAAAVKMTALSSKDGNAFVKATQSGNKLTFENIDTSTGSDDLKGFYRFYVGIANYSTKEQKVILDTEKCSIGGGAGTAYKYTRVAVDELVASTPTDKGNTKVTFMSNSGANQRYAEDGDYGNLNDNLTDWAKKDDGTTDDISEIKTDSDIIKDIAAYSGDDIVLGNIAKATINSTTNEVTPTIKYCVVTVWFEGMEVANQNGNIEDNFNVKLAFTGENVTA